MILYNQYIKSHSSQTPTVRIIRASVEKFTRPFVEHSHSDFEITLFLSGRGKYIVNSKDVKNKYVFSSGDVVVFASNEMHYIKDIYDESCEYIAIHFDPKYLWEGSASGLSDENSNFCFNHSDSFINVLPRHDINTEKIKNLIFEAENEIIEKPPEYRMMIRSFINEIIVIIIRNFRYAASEDSSAQSHSKTIKNVIEYIDENLNRSLSLNDISVIAKMSPNYFCTIFKQRNNITVFDYIISKRCDLAAQLLVSNPEMNIIEIAEQCGFNNSANFNKSFKKRIGLTPSKYRKNNEIF